jgi:hypothetical protein
VHSREPLRAAVARRGVDRSTAEKLHPHVPKVVEIQEATKNLTQEERAFVRVRAKALADYAKAVGEAVS